MSVYLSIDLGTTGCRSSLFDSSLKQLSLAYEEYGLITPAEDRAEQDANLWWEITLCTAKSAIEKAGIDPKEIKAISVSSQGITVVPVDKDINPLCNALNWLDLRAKEQKEQIEKDFGAKRILEITGKGISAGSTLPKILWFYKECPDICKKTWKFLMPMDFLIAKFTGNCITDHSMASGTLMYDIKNGCWSKEILEHYGICEDLLPQISWSGKKAGCVLPNVANELGLSESCVVSVGAQDQKCAAYGVGLDDGIMTISLGTAAAITKRWNEIDVQKSRGAGWCGYVCPGTWVTEGVISTAGTCLRWVRDTMFPGESYDVINKEAIEARERGSSLLFYSYLTGPSSPDYYPDSEGTFYGVNLSTQRGNFALAVMEGIAFQIKIILEDMEAYGNTNTIILFGGVANSALWCQIIADVTGMTIKIPETGEAASAGAAILAADGIGEAVEPLKSAMEYKPGAQKEVYMQKYKKFRTIEKKLWQQEEK